LKKTLHWFPPLDRKVKWDRKKNVVSRSNKFALSLKNLLYRFNDALGVDLISLGDRASENPLDEQIEAILT
jgi:hypothetical protein